MKMMKIQTALLVILSVSLCRNAQSGQVESWVAQAQQNRPVVPEKTSRPHSLFGVMTTANGDEFAEDKIIAEQYLPFTLPGDATWTRIQTPSNEYLSECQFTTCDGMVCRFGVYGQYGCKTAYYWTGENIASCGKGVASYAESTNFVARVLSHRHSRMDLRGTQDVLNADDVTVSVKGTVVDCPFERFRFVFADDRPGANWGHKCRYVFLAEDLSSFVVSFRLEMPKITRKSDGTRIWLLPGFNTCGVSDLNAVKALVYSAQKNGNAPSATYYTGDKEHSYYLLICGGDEKEKNHIRFWSDTAMLYSTLTKKYGIDDSHICVLMSDGVNTAADACLGYNSNGQAIYVSSPTDLDGDGVSDINGCASWSNLCTVFNSLKNSLTSEDQLFVFVTSHGGARGTEGESNHDCAAALFSPTGDGKDIDGYYANFTDENLYDLTKDIVCPIAFAIETCNSGGFIDDLIVSKNRIVATACNHYESSSGWTAQVSSWPGGATGKTFVWNKWAMPFISAARGYIPLCGMTNSSGQPVTLTGAYPWEDGDACCNVADSNGDGKVSFYEASVYAKENDSAACKRTTHSSTLCGDVEHPQYGESTSGLGNGFYFVKQMAGTTVPVMPAAPAVTITGTTLSWNAVSGAKYYKVYRATNPYAEPTELSSWLTSTSLSVQRPASENSVYFYYVKAASSQNDAAASAFSSERVFLAYPTWFTSGSDYTEMYYYTASSSETKQSIHSDKGLFGAAITFTPLSNASSAFTAYVDDKAVTSSGLKVGSTTSFGSAAKTLTLTHSANTSTSPRTYGFTTSIQAQSLAGETYVHWSGRPHYFYQAGVNSVSLDAATQSVGKEGGAYTVNVAATPTTVAWTATVSDNAKDWITLYRTGSTGSGVLGYVVAENTSGTRQGTISVGGKTLTVTQAGSVAVSLSSISISGESTVTSGGNTTYTCTATMSDETTKAVTPTWSIYSGSSYASISTSGKLTANTVTSSQSVTVKASYTEGGVTKTATKSVTINPPAVSLSSISINGPDYVYAGKTGNFAASATMSDGTTNSITPTWSIYSGASYASISAAGVLTGKTVSSPQSVTIKASYTEGGVTKTATKTVTVYPTFTLATALDNNTLTFTTGGNADWFGQGKTTYDGTDAARSGIITHNQNSWMQTTVTGPGTFSFKWYASSEIGTSSWYDYLTFSIDGVQTNKIGGTSCSWTQCSYTLGTGIHTLKWNYLKDGTQDKGEDAGFVDQIVWTPTQTYTVYYNPGSQGTGSQKTAIKTHDIPLTLLGATFTRDGYTQTGWATTDGGSQAYALNAAYTANAGVTLYPVWTPNTYTITYNPGSQGTGSQKTATKTHDIPLTLLGATFTRDGYTQTGWATTDGGAQAYPLNGVYTANATATFYPVWTMEAMPPPTSEEIAESLDCCLLDFYAEVSADGVGYWRPSGANMIISGLSSGQWSSVMATANGPCFVDWNWACVSNKSECGLFLFVDNEVVDMARSSTGEHSYRYIGDGEHTLDWCFIQGDMPAGSQGGLAGLNAVGVYYPITYDLNGAEGSLPIPPEWYYRHVDESGHTNFFFEVGGEVSLLSASGLSNPGYSFVGWECSLDGEVYEAGEGYVVPDEPTVFTAKWEVAQTYTVTYRPGANGVGSQKTSVKAHGVALQLLGATFTRTGYTQTGWSTTDGGAQAYALNAMYAANAAMTLYPVWTANTYMVAFSANGGDGSMEAQSFTYDVAQNLRPNAFTRGGYEFLGWARSPNAEAAEFEDGESVVNLAEEDGSSLTLYAVWEELPPPAPIPSACATVEAAGWDGLGHVMAGDWISFTLRYEFSKDKSVPVQELAIANQLSDAFDWSTFTIEEIYADETADSGLSGKQNGSCEFFNDSRSDSVKVRASVSYDEGSGAIRCYIRAYDQSKIGGWPDEDDGIVKPDGCAYFKYRVRVREGALLGTEISTSPVFAIDLSEVLCPILPNRLVVSVQPDAPTGLAVSFNKNASGNNYLATLSWNGDWPAGTKYVIYKSSSILIDWDNPYAVTTDTSYTDPDEGLTGGATVYYAVCAWPEGPYIQGIGATTSAVVPTLPSVVATPVITPADGATFSGESCEVTITCATAGALIYYTTNGVTPKTSSKYLYAGPFTVTDTVAIKAVATKDGLTKSEYATATISRLAMTLERAIGATSDMIVTTGGDAEWQPVSDVTVQTGSLSARSGLTNDDDECESWLQVAVSGSGKLTFFAKTSCEHDDDGTCTWDRLMVYADGTEMLDMRMDGENGWKQKEIVFDAAGAHTVRWVYHKDEADYAGEDCAWVYGVAWTPSDADPIPELPPNPTSADVEAALAESADMRLQECITEPAEYNAYRTWAETVKAPGGSTAAGAQAVKDSPNAWLSFALDSATLIQNPPEDGDVKVEKFEQTATAGAFDFTVGVENIPVGDDAKPSNLAKVFGIEGGSTLSPQDMSADKVDITFGTPENGKVKFTAGPKDKTQPSFFMRVKMK